VLAGGEVNGRTSRSAFGYVHGLSTGPDAWIRYSATLGLQCVRGTRPERDQPGEGAEGSERPGVGPPEPGSDEPRPHQASGEP
jgi:hypothetical protein